MKAMQMAGIISGKDGNQFDPTGTKTRAEVSAVLRCFVEMVVDPASAQGWDKNVSSTAMLYENGKGVKSARRTVGSSVYNFNLLGEAALLEKKKYRLHTVKNNEYFWSISRLFSCTQEEIMSLNNLKKGDFIHPGDTLKVPIPALYCFQRKR